MCQSRARNTSQAAQASLHATLPNTPTHCTRSHCESTRSSKLLPRTHPPGERSTTCAHVPTAAESFGPLPVTSNISKNEHRHEKRKKGERGGGRPGREERRRASAGTWAPGAEALTAVRQERSHLEAGLWTRLQRKSVTREEARAAGPVRARLRHHRQPCAAPCRFRVLAGAAGRADRLHSGLRAAPRGRLGA